MTEPSPFQNFWIHPVLMQSVSVTIMWIFIIHFINIIICFSVTRTGFSSFEYILTIHNSLFKDYFLSCESREQSQFSNIRIFKKLTLAEFAVSATVYLGPICVRCAHVTSILGTPFTVLAGVAGDYNGSPHRGRSRLSSSCNGLRCSMSICCGTIYFKTNWYK
jgi:hypothetical protein